jgi:hypothetical protein
VSYLLKKKTTSKDGLIAMPDSPSRLRIYNLRMTVVFLTQHWGGN